MKVTKKQLKIIISETFDNTYFEEDRSLDRASIVADVSDAFDSELQSVQLNDAELRDISSDISAGREYLEDLLRAFRVLINYNKIDKTVSIALKPSASDSESDREAKREIIDSKLAQLIEDSIKELTN